MTSFFKFGLTILLTFGLCLSARADKFFSHSAVGRLGDLESRVTMVVTAQVERSLRGRRITESEGRLQFFDANGNAKQVRVSGQGINDQVLDEIPYSVGRGKLSATFDVRSVSPGLERVWVWMREDDGKAGGALTFQISQAGQRITDATVFASEALNNSVVTINPGDNDRPGVAVANPNDTPVTFFVIAVDPQENSHVTELTLPARGQTAQFVDELFPQLGPRFGGFLALASPRELASVALNQNELSADISVLETFPGEESAVPLPVGVGRVFNMLASEEFSSGSQIAEGSARGQFRESDALLFMRQSTTTDVGGGTIVFSKGNEQVEVQIGSDGGFLSPVLSEGSWEMTLQVPGFFPMTQTLQFPRPAVDRELIPRDAINLEWLSETLTEGRNLKPSKQFEFFFDNNGQSGEGVDQAREVFESWARFALPQLGIEVEDGSEVLGGTVTVVQGAPWRADRIVVQAVPGADETEIISFVNNDTGEARGGVIRFNPNCATCPQKVARDLWTLVFGRTLSDRDLASFGLSSIVTQLASEPNGFTATALDRLYWRILRNRPALTQFTSEQEILPAEADLP